MLLTHFIQKEARNIQQKGHISSWPHVQNARPCIMRRGSVMHPVGKCTFVSRNAHDGWLTQSRRRKRDLKKRRDLQEAGTRGGHWLLQLCRRMSLNDVRAWLLQSHPTAKLRSLLAKTPSLVTSETCAAGIRSLCGCCGDTGGATTAGTCASTRRTGRAGPPCGS